MLGKLVTPVNRLADPNHGSARSSGASLVHRRIPTQTFRAASVRGNASITAAAPSLQGKQVFCGEDEYVWRVFKVIIREGGVRTLSFGHFGNF